MQLSILLLTFYSIHILCCLLALKINIKYQIKNTQRKIRFFSENTTKMQNEKKQKQKLMTNNFCKVYAYLFKKYTLIGFQLSRKAAHIITILFSYSLSYLLINYGVHWALSSSIPILSCLICIIVQYEYYKCIFLRDQQERINKIVKLIYSNKLAVIIYTSITLTSLVIMFFLTYAVVSNLNGDTYSQKLIGYGFILCLDNFVYKPLTFILAAKVTSQSLFLQMIEKEEQREKAKKQIELKDVINFSQEQLNQYVKDGGHELKQTKNIIVSSICNRKYESQNQFIKSKSINQIISNKQFFFLPEDKINSRVKREQSRKTAHFFAINQLQINNTQFQFPLENQTKSLGQIKYQKGHNIPFLQLYNKDKYTESHQQTKILRLFPDDCKNHKTQTNHSQNTLSDSCLLKSKKQSKGKIFKQDNQGIKQSNLVEVEQLQTQLQQELNQQQLKEHSTNTFYQYIRARKRRATTQSQLQQQNLIKIYLDGNKQEIKDFKPRRKQSQIALQIAKRTRTGKHSNGRSKPIVHQSQQQPNFFKLSEL